jgi:hypothetical protein
MEQNAYIMACNNLKASFFNKYDDIMNYCRESGRFSSLD